MKSETQINPNQTLNRNLCRLRRSPAAFLALAALSLLLSAQLFATPAPVKQRTIKVLVHPRTIQNLPNFPLSTLKTSLSPGLYKSLSVSNVDAWIVAQVPAYGGDSKIIHSEAGGL